MSGKRTRSPFPVVCPHPHLNHQHGTRQAYDMDGCGCDLCRAIKAAEGRRWAKAKVYRAWGVGPGPRNIDATGTRRRIEALATVGWSATAIADRLGVTKAAVRQLTLRHRVTVEKAAAIAAVYDELWDKKPPARNKPERISVAKTRGNALRMGLHPPLSWNDEDIDDPLAVPYIEPEPVKKRGIKKRANVEDIEWLASCSLSAPQIAARLAVSVYALEMECRRQDRNDLWLSLAAKERVAA